MGDRRNDRQIWRLANALSLDAVLVGLTWQLVFTRQFCQRLPAPHEMAIVGLSIWLVYTIDRLLDSLRLDTSRPHSFRHRFHLRYRKRLCFVWLTALGINAANVVCFASEPQLRWGCMAIAVVIGYVVGVQLVPKPKMMIPKELQVGLVFAFGVSLTAWSEVGRHETTELLIATMMAGLLFAGNCLAIAGWERHFDIHQNFDSFALRMPQSTTALPTALIFHAIATVILGAVGLMGPLVLGCLIASDCMLFLITVGGHRLSRKRNIEHDPPPSNLFDWNGALVSLADVSLMIPPLGWAAGWALSASIA